MTVVATVNASAYSNYRSQRRNCRSQGDSVYSCENDTAGSQDRERYRCARLGDSSGALGGRERRAAEFAERGGGVS